MGGAFSRFRDIGGILDAFANGQLTPAQALNLFREFRSEVGTVPGNVVKPASPAPGGGEAEGEPQGNPNGFLSAMRELDSLVGLGTVKSLVKELLAFVEVQKRRASQQLAAEPLVLHMIFRGNPGTGKTTVARIIGKTFKEMGILERGHLVEVERADIVGEYIGHTAQKTREQVRRALGGILFIDEAYSLARGGEKDFGKEAIDCLVKAMEDYKDRFILILAGYRDEMAYFINTNPGLKSRFPIQIDFPDYSIDELMKIADIMLAKRDYMLDPQARARMRSILMKAHEYGEDSTGNARLVRNIIERAIRRQAVRIIEKGASTREELILIRKEDLSENL